jgi:hypothetical protein
MIDHVWTVVCSRAVVDSESNNISLQDVIEQIEIHGEPIPNGVLPIVLDVATLWTRSSPDEPSSGHTRLTFLSPSGEALSTLEADLDLSKHERHRSRMRFQGLTLRESGRHYFRVELRGEDETEWHQVAAVPLEIAFKPPETGQTENEPE